MTRSGSGRSTPSSASVPPPPPPPPPSTGGSSQTDVAEPDPAGSKAKIQCYNCSRPGHYQSGCTFLPHCALWNRDGHTTGMCPAAAKAPEIKWFGFVIPGASFYAFDCPPSGSDSKDNTAYILADDPQASEEVIVAGLRKLIKEDWDFQVRNIGETEYALRSPTATASDFARML